MNRRNTPPCCYSCRFYNDCATSANSPACRARANSNDCEHLVVLRDCRARKCRRRAVRREVPGQMFMWGGER